MARSRAQAFGDALRDLRRERGLSQEAAALACEIDRAHFGKIERGHKNPTLATIWKITDALGTQPSDVLRRAERLIG